MTKTLTTAIYDLLRASVCDERRRGGEEKHSDVFTEKNGVEARGEIVCTYIT
jgi:hypothetical protein